MRWVSLTVSMILCAAGTAFAQYGPVQEGQDLALRLCATCHAIGSAERSPNAAAPAFRHIEPRVDLDELGKRLQEGLIAGHPEMPVFVLREREARALVTYLRSLQTDRAR
ncbi:c-type cytochrome [Pseudorhodoplanes sinuspersici]|nr:cytochrome c [Pseudorhodoplanes sinuspersici]RKE72991.1 cytochrome c [Pseudorhodoplanes sinuspersici]